MQGKLLLAGRTKHSVWNDVCCVAVSNVQSMRVMPSANSPYIAIGKRKELCNAFRKNCAQYCGKIRTATANQQRAAGIAACQFALKAASVEHPAVLDAMRTLSEKCMLSEKSLAELNELVVDFDNKYSDFQDKNANSGDSSECLHLFCKARAVSSLCFAASEDPFAAAMEAVYEASVATKDSQTVFDIVLPILSSHEGRVI